MSAISKPKSKEANLLAALQRTVAPPVPAEPQNDPSPTVSRQSDSNVIPRVSAGRETKSRAGKPVQFWIHEEDRRLLRELSAWLAGQGERPTDSMVIRSALRVAKTGGELLNAYRQASQLDGRLKQHKTA